MNHPLMREFFEGGGGRGGGLEGGGLVVEELLRDNKRRVVCSCKTLNFRFSFKVTTNWFT